MELSEEIINLKEAMNAKEDERIASEVQPAKETNKIITGRDNIITRFNELLDAALHNVMLVVPTIADLKEIDLTKLKPSVKVLVSVKVDMTSQDDLDMVQGLSELNNIELRSFNNEDRFAINVDRGDVIIGVNSKNGPFGIHTQDSQAIDLFVKQFMLECWTLGRSLGKK
jgi:sugar-specific transcriptional regulator TrmB